MQINKLRAVLVFGMIMETMTPAFGMPLCGVTSAGIAFGAMDGLPGTTKDTLGTITVICTGTIGEPVSYSIALGPAAGGTAPRTMQAGSRQLRYSLYLDAAHLSPWGDGTAGTSTISDSYKLPASSFTRQYTVYGRIPSGQNRTLAGNYADTLTITLIY